MNRVNPFRFGKHGAGDYLHAVLLQRYGRRAVDGCGCLLWVKRMNKRGPQWCRENVDLIAARLIRSAAKEGSWLARIPGIRGTAQHTVCRWLVLEAIEMAEKAQHRRFEYRA